MITGGVKVLVSILIVFFFLVLNVAFAEGEDECEGISPESMGYIQLNGIENDVIYPTRSLCFLRRARKNADLKDCQKTGSLTYHCYRDLALLKDDPKVCDMALQKNGGFVTKNNGRIDRRNCLLNFALEKKRPEVCKMLDRQIKNCLEALNRKAPTQKEKDWDKARGIISALPVPSPRPSINPSR